MGEFELAITFLGLQIVECPPILVPIPSGHYLLLRSRRGCYPPLVPKAVPLAKVTIVYHYWAVKSFEFRGGAGVRAVRACVQRSGLLFS